MGDTSNFDDFEMLDEQKKCRPLPLFPVHTKRALSFIYLFFIAFSEEGDTQKDWVFQNYTFKRFEGLTQRGHLKP